MPLNSAAVQLGSTRRQEPLPPGAPFYRRLWRGWQRVARALGNLISRVVMSLTFAILLPIFALAARLFSDPLELKSRPSRWKPHPDPPKGIDDARSGF